MVAGRGRSDADDALAAALAAGKTVRDAAASAGVAERTAYRRLGHPAFRGKVSDLRAGMVGAACGRLADGMAAEAPVGLAADPDPGVRHRAAVKVIELGLKAREQAELEDRVLELERRLAAPPAGGRP